MRVDGLMEISSHYNENIGDMTVYNLICVTIKLGVFYYDKLGFSVYNRYIQGEDGKVIQYKIPKMLGWVGDVSMIYCNITHSACGPNICRHDGSLGGYFMSSTYVNLGWVV